MTQCGMSFLLATLLVWSGGAAHQSKPDFSGTWTLVDFRSGTDPDTARRGVGTGGGAAGQTGVVSGAAVNCGVECTITQTADTLTVSRPAGRDGTKPPDGVVYLDGRPMSGNVTVKWDDAKLVLTRRILEPLVVTQTFSREDDRLIVVAAIGDGKVGPFTLTYHRK